MQTAVLPYICSLTTAWHDLLELSHINGHFGRTPVNALSVTIANTSNRSFTYTVCYLITIAFPPLHLVLLAPTLFHVKSANPGGTGKTPLLLAIELLFQNDENSPMSMTASFQNANGSLDLHSPTHHSMARPSGVKSHQQPFWQDACQCILCY